MIIVTANVGLLPFEIGKKGAYITDKRVGFFNSARAQLNLRRFHHPGDNRGAESAQLRWRDWHERAAGWPWDDRWVWPIRFRGVSALARTKVGKKLQGENCAELFGFRERES